MKRLVISIMIMTLLVSFSTVTFAETIKFESQNEENNVRRNLQILVDTPTNLIYTYEYQGFIYKNVEKIQKNLIKTKIYKLNKKTQVYEITDKFSTNVNDSSMYEGYILGNKEMAPNNMVDPSMLPYKYDFSSEGSTHIANKTLAAIRTAVALALPTATAKVIASIANSYYQAGVSNMFYKYDVYREITDNHPVWYKEVRGWYLDENYNNYVKTTTEYYQWWD